MDYEKLPFSNELEIAVFFDALHHCENEVATLTSVFEALRPRGVCILSEPGTGYSAAEGSRNAVQRFGVNEKDMPPTTIWQFAKQVGFRQIAIRPNANAINQLLYD